MFSQASWDKLNTCHPDLIRVMVEVEKYYDCTILCGHRGQEEQDAAFAAGTSKLKWPNGNHNATPSNAVDATPFPIDWNNVKAMHLFAGFVIGIAAGMGVDLRWGGNWDRDWDLADNRFNDYPHFELFHPKEAKP